MHGAIRAAGFSLMTMFVSCGVGAQDPDIRIGKIAPQCFEYNRMQTVPDEQGFSCLRLYALTEACFDKRWKLDDITAVE